MKEKTKVTPVQLGEILYDFAVTGTTHMLKDSDILKELDIEKIDQNHLFKEIMTINFSAIIAGFQGLLNNTELEYEVLGNMRKLYYKELQEKMRLNKEEITQIHNHLFKRGEEYTALWNEFLQNKAQNKADLPAMMSLRMLANIRGEELKKGFKIDCGWMYIAQYYIITIKNLTELVLSYQVT